MGQTGFQIPAHWTDVQCYFAKYDLEVFVNSGPKITAVLQ